MNNALKILEIDNDEVTRTLVRRAFNGNAEAIEIDEASSYREALSAIESDRFDCVLIDSHLEQCNSVQIVRDARRRGIEIPFLVLTASEDEQIALEFLEAGASDYLSKAQLIPEVLRARLRNAIRIHDAEVRAARDRARLEESEQRYRLVLEGAHDGIWDWDLSQPTIHWNDRLFEITGLSRHEFSQTYQACFFLVHPDDRRPFLEALKAYLDRETHFELEVRLRHSSGSYRDCTIRVKVCRTSDGTPYRLTGIVVDITERKQAERRLAETNELLVRQNRELQKQQQYIQSKHLQLLEASRIKSKFLATVSHELRTPMNAVIGFSQLLLRQRQHPLTPKQVNMVERILDNGKSLLYLLDELLDFAQLDARASLLSAVEFDVCKLVRQSVEEIRPLAKPKALTLSIDCHLADPIIYTDRDRLGQVLAKLLSNAIKFTEVGSVRVEVAALKTDSIEIAIYDTGIGISNENLQKIFDIFYQVDQTIQRKYDGMGVGLAIADSLVKFMQGQIAVESKIGRGSVFRVRLPRRIST